MGITLVLSAVTPIDAAESFTLRPIVVADRGKDLDAVAQPVPRETDAKIVELVPPEHDTFDPTFNAYGTVVLEVDISQTGKLTKCKVLKSSGYRSLDQRALHTLETAKYKPATVAGRPVAGAYAVNVGFDLDD